MDSDHWQLTLRHWAPKDFVHQSRLGQPALLIFQKWHACLEQFVKSDLTYAIHLLESELVSIESIHGQGSSWARGTSFGTCPKQSS